MNFGSDLFPGNAHGFIGPIKPPSADWTTAPGSWHTDMTIANLYMWGRMDAGESHRDVNRNYAFAEEWADAKWMFKTHMRSSLPTMAGALALHDAGERF